MPGHRSHTGTVHKATKYLWNEIGTIWSNLVVKANDSAVVHNTGTETIEGAKTFSTVVTVPTPTANGHASTKLYVDNGLAGKSDTGHVHTIANVTGLQTAIDAKAPLASPAFTGTVTGISKGMVGLGSVDNTSDLAKPISTATQSALDGKAATAHAHTIANVTSLQAALDSKPTFTLIGGKIPTSLLEQVSIGETLTAANQTAMLALTANPGDVAIRSDNDTLWMLKKAPATAIGNWWDLTAALSGVAGVTSINSMTGVVTLGAADVGAVPIARTVAAGTGLTGGGALSANQTISLSTASITSLGKADTAVQGTVNGTSTATTIWRGTAAQYTAIGTKDANTVYLVTA